MPGEDVRARFAQLGGLLARLPAGEADEACRLLDGLRDAAERQARDARRLAESQADAIVNAGMMMSELEAAQEQLLAARHDAEAASLAKSEFLANMSHEIRTPMNGVLGVLQLALEGELPPQQRQRLEVAARSAGSLLRLLNDLLDFSKLEAGALQFETREFAPAELLADVAALFTPSCQEKGLSLETRIDARVARRYRGDPYRIEQVLTNLVGNAVKFTERGGVTVTLDCIEDGEGADSLCFAVRDTGIGLDDAQQRNLFRPFVQADASMSRRYGGTGLGLAICARLAEGMGGRMSVDSTPGHGATFALHLRLECAATGGEVHADAMAARVDADERLPAFDGARVLLTEDNLVNQAVALAMLEAYDLRIDCALNGREALEAGERGDYALVLMDCQMPVLDGLGATAEWRRREAARGARPVPIVAMTANALHGDAEACFAAGMNDYLPKPFTRAQLTTVLSRWLAERAAAVEPQSVSGR